MVISQIIGGLGNQMFQYAAGKALAEFYGVEFKIDISGFKEYKEHGYFLDKLAISAPVADENEIAPFFKYKPPSGRILKLALEKFDFLIPYGTKKIFFEPYFNFNRRFFKLPANIYLSGYFQSEKYFKNIEAVIRKEFVLKEKAGELYKELANSINNVNSVSIHFRRGDYVTNQSLNKVFGTPPLNYYYAAVEKIIKTTKDPHFYIFSNDLEWVKNNFKLTLPATYVFSPFIKNYEELFLMSACKHNIVANSSFSWWGAWLNNHPDKIVVAPKQWLQWKKINTQDIVPLDWVRI